MKLKDRNHTPLGPVDENVSHEHPIIPSDKEIDISAINDFILTDDLKADEGLLEFSFRSSIFDESVLNNLENEPPQISPENSSKIVIHDIQIIPPRTENPQLERDPPGTNENPTLTKKGEIRKRKKYNISLKERLKQKKEKAKEKFNLKPPCKNCPKKCNLHIPENRRIELNKNYQSLNFTDRKKFILSNTEQTELNNTENSKRCRSITYYFQDETGRRIKICKTFFLTTLGYHEKNDRFILQAISKSDNHISVSSDMRGKYPKTRKFNKDVIEAHIESFHPSVSHYRREHAPNKRYLPSDVSITLMYKDFLTKHPTFYCSYELYRVAVKAKNISFTKLGHEECECCAIFENHCHSKENIDPDCDICKTYTKHIKKAEESRNMYRNDAKMDHNNNLEVCYSADLQKVIMLPRLDQYKIALFTPRIIVFNESFVPVGKKCGLKPIACIWHEGIAGRKKEDIISTFYSFFLENRDSRIITLWLDNCSAQNKNWTFFSFLVYIINSSEIQAEKIWVKYFEPGHTYMSADSFHHQVELSMKYKGTLSDFKDFSDAVQAANSGKVTVLEMRINNFFNWIDQTSQVKIKKMQPRPYMTDITMILAERGKQYLTYFDNYNLEDPKTLSFLKAKPERDGIPKPLPCTKARGINKNKKEGIINKLCPLMAEGRRQFWYNIDVDDNVNDLNSSFE